jgi:hypothetical protein
MVRSITKIESGEGDVPSKGCGKALSKEVPQKSALRHPSQGMIRAVLHQKIFSDSHANLKDFLNGCKYIYGFHFFSSRG